MNGTMKTETMKKTRIPKFMEGEKLTTGYYDQPDPYKNPPKSPYNLRLLSRYAKKVGKKIVDLTKDEVSQFAVTLVNSDRVSS